MAGEETKFGEICAHSAFGPRFSSDDYAFDGNVATLRTTDISADGRIDYATMPIAQLDLDRFSNHVLQKDDMVITRTGRVGTTAVFTEFKLPVLPGAFLIRFRLNRTIADPKFYCYFFNSRLGQSLIASVATGSVQQNLNITALHGLDVPLPPLAEQKAIAAVLGELDDKIELNRRMNATLEAMARALFQSWFIDFDPVRRNMDRNQPSTRPSGHPSPSARRVGDEGAAGIDFDPVRAKLDPDRSGPTPNLVPAAIFPDSFQDSAIGHIPKGWEVKMLGEVIELAYGKPLKAEDRRTGPICVYGANGPVGWHDEKLVSGPGIVVGRKGNPGVVTWAHGDFYPIDTTFYVETKGDCRSLYFLFYALSNHNLANLSADSAVPGLNRNHAYMSKQVIPPAPLLEVFDKQAAPIFDAIKANASKSRTLATLRDTLLPKLLSGELRVSDELLHPRPKI
jgi:type I restriction enzyme S subunit